MSAQDFTCTEGGVLLPPLDINQPHTFLSVLYGLSLLWVRALLRCARAAASSAAAWAVQRGALLGPLSGANPHPCRSARRCSWASAR